MSRARDFSKSVAETLVSGTTAARPGSPSEGQIRFNTDIAKYEGYSHGFWRALRTEEVVDNKTAARFTFSATDQSWVVPSGITKILVKAWAGGGGGGHFGGWTQGSHGGGAGFSKATLTVTPGETLTLRVPRGGFAFPGATNAPFGGGSSTVGGDNQYGAGGCGYCGVFRSTTPLIIAGAGGGGGSTLSYQGMANGGAGGGLTGKKADVARNYWTSAGKGGTQTAGGAATVGDNQNGQAGSSLQGGSCVGNPYGGGGGGGYFGGSAGAYTGGNSMPGGGGGSGYIISSALNPIMISGSFRTPGGVDDIDYPYGTSSTYGDVGFGGVSGNHGGDGHLVIWY